MNSATEARRLTDGVAWGWPAQSISGGAAGIALLHLERARTGAGPWEKANAWLEAAAREGASTGTNACLYYGAPALAFVLHGGADRPGYAQALATVDAGTRTVVRTRLDAAHRRIDAGDRPALGEFDLISGLTGLGVCQRRRGDLDLLRQVLTYLVRLTEPLHGLPGWWTLSSTGRTVGDPPGGHSNHGMAHGITGPLALLSLAMRDGIEVEGQAEAIHRLCAWLDRWERPHESGAWWPEIVTLTDMRRERPAQAGPLRPSWCYKLTELNYEFSQFRGIWAVSLLASRLMVGG
ncbi:lanthionine synthetase C family protein, partial [Acrocarpospora pleiomorpha]|uniref:lanthionine synthetase C family protein n=2 Tax=Acrocarpospora pleiomorpha TaxID=90975 RepID=UPI0031DEAAFB